MRVRAPRKLKPVKPSHANELWYRRQLLLIADELAKQTSDTLLPILKMYEPTYVKAKDGMIGDEAPNSAIDRAIENLAKRFGSIQNVATKISAIAVEKSKGAVDERLKQSIKNSLKIDIGPILRFDQPLKAAMAQATEANVGLITSIPEQYFGRISKAVQAGIQNGQGYNEIARSIGTIKGMTRNRAKLIARDQTSKMNSAFNRIRQTSVGINKYQWQTSGDERVRDTHAANDGKTFAWDTPPATTGNPGDDINCRCVAIPVFDLDEE